MISINVIMKMLMMMMMMMILIKKTKRSALLHFFKSKWSNRTNNALEYDRNV